MVKKFKALYIPTVVDSIVISCVLTRCALLHFVYDIKIAQIKVQCCLIWELKIYKFELDQNAVEVSKNICCVKC